MNHWIPVTVLIIIFLLVLAYLMYNRDTIFSVSNAPEEGKIVFVSRPYMQNVVDDSYYFLRMTPTDLLARNIGSSQGYIKLYKDSIQDFGEAEKKHIRYLIDKLNAYTRVFDSLHALPWKFAKIQAHIEKGYPHTLKDVIILSKVFFELSESQQLNTLLHEKIHVYQRAFPIETEKLITEGWGFVVVDKHENFPLARNNPDINNFVYAIDDNKLIQLYSSKAPKDISDSEACSIDKNGSIQPLDVSRMAKLGIPSVVTQTEHPYEIMATLLPELLINHHKDDTRITKHTIQWMKIK